jgi:hypothetical protein
MNHPNLMGWLMSQRVTRLFGVVQVLAYTLLLLGTRVEAVDVTGSMGVLAYTLEACPAGWDDQSTSDPYRGRLIKGWNPVPAVDMGATLLTSSTGNDVFSHRHAKYSLKIAVKSGNIGLPTINGGGTWAASDRNFVDDTNCGQTESTTRIPSKL